MDHTVAWRKQQRQQQEQQRINVSGFPPVTRLLQYDMKHSSTLKQAKNVIREDFNMWAFFFFF